jgi:uncharacterized phage infection (PIP) family protein YhgE
VAQTASAVSPTTGKPLDEAQLVADTNKLQTTIAALQSRLLKDQALIARSVTAGGGGTVVEMVPGATQYVAVPSYSSSPAPTSNSGSDAAVQQAWNQVNAQKAQLSSQASQLQKEAAQIQAESAQLQAESAQLTSERNTLAADEAKLAAEEQQLANQQSSSTTVPGRGGDD